VEEEEEVEVEKEVVVEVEEDVEAEEKVGGGEVWRRRWLEVEVLCGCDVVLEVLEGKKRVVTKRKMCHNVSGYDYKRFIVPAVVLCMLDCSSAGVQTADCAAVHGASSALQAAFGARLRVV
jgi:hypothetical protein